MPWLNLIRWQNLLIIFFTQLLAWWAVILPEQTGTENMLLANPINFLCLAISTVLIAAAGYIINDYFDIRIDSINHPEKMVLGKLIPRKTAIILHILLNVLALVLAGYIVSKGGHYEWLLLQAACATLLWLYSTHMKRQYVTGNVVVALLTALTVLELILYEPALHQGLHFNLLYAPAGQASSFPVWVLAVYAWFAFMLTWMREIVKDMEDLKGDEAEGCTTMPIKLGLERTARFTMMLALMVVISLIIAVFALYVYHYILLAAYTAIFLLLPLAGWILFLPHASDTKHYGRASRGLKIIMVLGICSLLIYHIQLK